VPDLRKIVLVLKLLELKWEEESGCWSCFSELLLLVLMQRGRAETGLLIYFCFHFARRKPESLVSKVWGSWRKWEGDHIGLAGTHFLAEPRTDFHLVKTITILYKFISLDSLFSRRDQLQRSLARETRKTMVRIMSLLSWRASSVFSVFFQSAPPTSPTPRHPAPSRARLSAQLLSIKTFPKLHCEVRLLLNLFFSGYFQWADW